MSSEDRLTDDDVAELLKRDARETSIKYSSMGLQAFLPQRPLSKAPKPNTRFLKNVIRDADSHNAALLAKEADESRQRLLRIHGSSEGKGSRSPWRRESSVRPLDEKPRDEHRSRKRRRGADESERRSSQRTKGHEHRSRGHPGSDSEHELYHDKHLRRDDRRSRQAGEGYSRDESSPRYKDKSRRNRRSHSPRRRHPCSPERESHKEGRERRRRGHRHERSSRSPRSRHGSHRPSRAACNEPDGGNSRKKDDSDSDPLESIVGPLPASEQPAVKSRGRGAFASSAMDARFADGYDPTADAHPNSASEDDWDQALEALRDRQRWKQQGAERLRAAGFTDVEVEKWEHGSEKTEQDVRWTRAGEGREWDRGKVVDGDEAS